MTTGIIFIIVYSLVLVPGAVALILRRRMAWTKVRIWATGSSCFVGTILFLNADLFMVALLFYVVSAAVLGTLYILHQEEVSYGN